MAAESWPDAYGELRYALLRELGAAVAERVALNSRIERIESDLAQAQADHAQDRLAASMDRLAAHWERRTGERYPGGETPPYRNGRRG